MLATRFPAQYASVPAWRSTHEDASLSQAELAVFGVDHAQAGSALAAYWKFPPAIQDAIRHQHCTNASGLAQAVGLAHRLAYADDAGAEHLAWERLDVDAPQRRQLTEHCTLIITDMCQILVNQEPS